MAYCVVRCRTQIRRSPEGGFLHYIVLFLMCCIFYVLFRIVYFAKVSGAVLENASISSIFPVDHTTMLIL